VIHKQPIAHFNREALLSGLGNSEVLAAEVLELLKKDVTGKQLHALHEAFESGSEEQVRFYAHALKGSARNGRFEVLAALTMSLEKLEPFTWEKAKALMDEIEAEIALLERQV